MTSLSNKKTLLVVNDDPNTLELLQRHLASQEYETLVAKDMVEAIRILETTPVDLVIIDLNILKADGHDLIKRLRENFLHTEVMIVTGYAAIREAVAAAKAGAAEYLVKPFTEEELFAVVQKALGKLSVRQAVKVQAYPSMSAPEISTQNSFY